MRTWCSGPSSVPTCVLLSVMTLEMIYELNLYIPVVFDHCFCTQVGKTHYDLSTMKYLSSPLNI